MFEIAFQRKQPGVSHESAQELAARAQTSDGQRNEQYGGKGVQTGVTFSFPCQNSYEENTWLYCI